MMVFQSHFSCDVSWRALAVDALMVQVIQKAKDGQRARHVDYVPVKVKSNLHCAKVLA